MKELLRQRVVPKRDVRHTCSTIISATLLILCARHRWHCHVARWRNVFAETAVGSWRVSFTKRAGQFRSFSVVDVSSATGITNDTRCFLILQARGRDTLDYIRMNLDYSMMLDEVRSLSSFCERQRNHKWEMSLVDPLTNTNQRPTDWRFSIFSTIHGAKIQSLKLQRHSLIVI